jgi:nitroreductase
METLETIFTRRSIRKYKNDEIPEELIKKLLEAAMYAPSAGNEQPWHFIIIDDKKILNKIPEFHPFSDMLRQVNVAILICGDTKLEKYKGFWVEDCSAAAQNILLAAHSMGLGTVWCGIYPHMDRVDGFRNLFNFPDNIIPLVIIPVGYPDELKDKPERFIESRIHHNSW